MLFGTLEGDYFCICVPVWVFRPQLYRVWRVSCIPAVCRASFSLVLSEFLSVFLFFLLLHRLQHKLVIISYWDLK